jgi:hypothetical protein
VAQGVPGRLGSRISLTFGTTRVVGRQPYTSAAFTPGEIPGTHFQRLSRPQGTWFPSVATEKIPSATTGNRSRDRPTNSAVPPNITFIKSSKTKWMVHVAFTGKRRRAYRTVVWKTEGRG